MASNYKAIGSLIHLIDNRNTDLKVDKLVGLTVEKRFIPSVANIIGTDLSTYKIIYEHQFACSLMQVSRDGKMPVAMYKGKPAIMSPAYPMFEVNDENELMPEYLQMYLSRSEFDREAVFYAVGGVRGSLEWEDFCNMQVPVPSIEEQRRIVNEYQTVERRIRNNEALIQKLEETAQAIYYHTFVEGIDEENLPEEWRIYYVKEFVNVITGKKDANIATSYGKYPFFTCSKGDYKTDNYSFEGNAILVAGNGDFSVKLYNGKFEAYQRTYVLIPENDFVTEFLFVVIKDQIDKIAKEARGSVISFLTKNLIEDIKFYAPKNMINTVQISHIKQIYNYIAILKRESIYLRKLLTLLTSKLS